MKCSLYAPLVGRADIAKMGNVVEHHAARGADGSRPANDHKAVRESLFVECLVFFSFLALALREADRVLAGSADLVSVSIGVKLGRDAAPLDK